MPVLESPTELKDYCLRKLGSPVINIEIDDTQTFDRIDEATDKFIHKHYNGTTEVYIVHTITAKEVSKGFIKPNSNLVSILDVLDADGSGSGSSIEEFDRLNFRLAQTDILDRLVAGGISEYHLTYSHYNLIRDVLTPSRSFQYNPIRRYLNVSDVLIEGNKLILHGYENINVESDVLVYNDIWLKKYATALIKQQWGTNVKKYDSVALPGGITMNGQIIYDEATLEIEKLDEEFELKYELPIDFFMAPSFI